MQRYGEAITVRTMVTTRIVGPSESSAETEVGELDVSATIDKHVVGLDVAVDEAHPVYTVDRQYQLGDEELRQSLVEDAQSDQ